MTTARYNQGLYNQAVYNNLHVDGSIQFGFNAQGLVHSVFYIQGNSSLSFSDNSSVSSGITGSSGIEFQLENTGIQLRTSGSLLFSFIPDANLSVEPSYLFGNSEVEFNLSGTLEGDGILSGSDNILFDTTPLIYGVGEVSSLSGIEFSAERALLNAAKMNVYLSEIIFNNDVKLSYENSLPFYSDWDGSFMSIKSNTSGTTSNPFVSTNSDYITLRRETSE